MQTLDQLFPPRPAMPVVVRDLFQSSRYVATLTRAGLIVQSHRTGTGRRLPLDHPQFNDYVSAIEGAIDADEARSTLERLTVPA